MPLLFLELVKKSGKKKHISAQVDSEEFDGVIGGFRDILGGFTGSEMIFTR